MKNNATVCGPSPKTNRLRRRLVVTGLGMFALAPLLVLLSAPDGDRHRATPRDDQPYRDGPGRLGPGSQMPAPLLAAATASETHTPS
jgi:hypothetical protein